MTHSQLLKLLLPPGNDEGLESLLVCDHALHAALDSHISLPGCIVLRHRLGLLLSVIHLILLYKHMLRSVPLHLHQPARAVSHTANVTLWHPLAEAKTAKKCLPIFDMAKCICCLSLQVNTSSQPETSDLPAAG